MSITVKFDSWRRHDEPEPGYTLTCTVWDGDILLGTCAMPIDLMSFDLVVKRPTGTSPTANRAAAVRALAEVLARVVRDTPTSEEARTSAERTWAYAPNDADLRRAGQRAAALDRDGTTMPQRGEVIHPPT